MRCVREYVVTREKKANEKNPGRRVVRVKRRRGGLARVQYIGVILQRKIRVRFCVCVWSHDSRDARGYTGVF